ncbi:MAG: glycosidase [Chloroflexota bacterium]|nr:glycosidase [Chloroflexota bacterium]
MAGSGEFRCDRCGRTFESRERLEAHWVESHEIERAETIGCDECGTEFDARGQLDKHKREQHPTSERPRGSRRPMTRSRTAAAPPFTLERIGVLMSSDSTIAEEVEGVLNPGVARGPDRELYLFPRVVGKGNYSRVGIARVWFDDSGDPTGVERLGYALEPTEPYELREGGGGCEDPRVTYIEPLRLYVMAYTSLGPTGPRIALAVSEDLRSWRRLGLVDFQPDPDPVYGVEFDEYHNKDAAFFPLVVDRPDGTPSLAMIHRPAYTKEDMPHGVTEVRPSIWISYCALPHAQRDVRALGQLRYHHPLIEPREPWEELRIGGGAQPVLTRDGWLLIYHGAAGTIPDDPKRPKRVRYSAGALVVDRSDPRRVLYRSRSPVLDPETREETEGVVPQVVFPTGADDRGDGRVDVYYGMADSFIGAARLHVPDRLPRAEDAAR